MFERCNATARKVLQLAHREAVLLNHEYLGSEHLLVGLVREGTPFIERVLQACGRHPGDVTALMEGFMKPGVASVPLDKLPLTLAMKRILESAADVASRLGVAQVAPEHLLLAIFADPECDAAALLADLGIRRETVESMLRAEAASQSEATMVHAGAPSASTLSAREVSADELAAVLTADPVPLALLQGDMPLPSLGEDLLRAERHLRNVQLVLGAVLGLCAGGLLFDTRGLAIGLVGGIIVAAFRDSLVGALAAGAAGFFVGRHYEAPGDAPLFALTGAAAGAFLGSWLGDAWRPKKTAPPPPRDDADA